MEAKIRSDLVYRVKRYQKKRFIKYLIVVSAFLVNGQVFGHNYATQYLYSTLLLAHPDQEMHISLVGSFTFGLIFFCGIFMVALVKYIPERWIFLLGLSLFSCAPIISAFMNDMRFWYFSYALPRGLGGSILYLLSFSTAANAFPNNVCTACTIVSLGASVFSILTPLMVESLLKYGGLVRFLVIDGLCMLIFLVFAPIYKNKLPKSQKTIEIISNLDQSAISLTSSNRIDLKSATNNKSVDNLQLALTTTTIINQNNWPYVFQMKKFIIFLIISVIFLSFYNVPYVHSHNYLMKLSSNAFHSPLYVTTVMGVGAILSKCLAAFLVEYRKLSSTFLLQISLLMFGIGLTLFGLLSNFDSDRHFYTFLLYIGSFTLGIGEGCIWSLLYPVCYYCAQPYTDPSIFCIYSTIISLPCSFGAPFASMIYNNLGSYPIAFFIGGLAYLVAANIFWLINSSISRKMIPVVNNSDNMMRV